METENKYSKEQAELDKILNTHLDEGFLSLRKTFSVVFYTELFRLNGWTFTVEGIKKRPTVVGNWTKNLICEQYNDVFIGLNTKITLHQSFSSDVGRTTLNNLVQWLIGIMQVSENMDEMWCLYEKLATSQGRQVETPYKFNDEGQTIEPIEQSTLSGFAKNLQKTFLFDTKKLKSTNNTE